MALIVQKYGGSSVADAKKIKSVARRIAAAREKDNRVVVVVSAMGETTDDLIKLAYQIDSRPSARVVASRISACAFTGGRTLAE